MWQCYHSDQRQVPCLINFSKIYRNSTSNDFTMQQKACHCCSTQNGLLSLQASVLFPMRKIIIKTTRGLQNNVIKELYMISFWNKSRNQHLHNNQCLTQTRNNYKKTKGKERGKPIGFRESRLYDHADINLQKCSVIY